MRRLSMWVLLVAAVAAIAGLLLLMRADPSAGAARSDAAREDHAARDETHARADTRSATASRPRLPDAPAPVSRASNSETPDAPAPRVYVRDNGTIVSDFRANAPPPTLRGRALRPQPAGLVEPTAILAVRNAMRPIVGQCVERLPAASLGRGARMQSQVVIRIEGGRLLVDEVTTGARDVAESDVAGLQACVEDQVSALALDVAGHQDVSQYLLRLPFQLRR